MTSKPELTLTRTEFKDSATPIHVAIIGKSAVMPDEVYQQFLLATACRLGDTVNPVYAWDRPGKQGSPLIVGTFMSGTREGASLGGIKVRTVLENLGFWVSTTPAPMPQDDIQLALHLDDA